MKGSALVCAPRARFDSAHVAVLTRELLLLLVVVGVVDAAAAAAAAAAVLLVSAVAGVSSFSIAGIAPCCSACSLWMTQCSVHV
jgi:hypothetical protein